MKTILMVGATEPHKRHVIGVEAVSEARNASGEDLRLLIVGPRGRSESDVLQALTLVDPTGTWTSRKTNVSEEELEHIYGHSWVLLQPSELEGYGLPVGEAASKGIPTIHSGMGALSEIAPIAVDKDAVPESYAEKICSLLTPQAYSSASIAARNAASAHSEVNFAEVLSKALDA